MMKDIKGYEGLYAVDELGNVWSYRNSIYLSSGITTRGYEYVNLCKNGVAKNHKVHRLVLEAFNPVVGMENLQVNHIDENKLNNNISNLEWTTARENSQHSINKRKGKKLGKRRKVEQYSSDGKFIAVYPSQAAAARETGVCQRCISSTCQGEQHTAGGYIWRFRDNGEEN